MAQCKNAVTLLLMHRSYCRLTLSHRYVCKSALNILWFHQLPQPPSEASLGWDNSLHWRHNDHDGVSNHQPNGCLLNRLFRRRSKKTSKLSVTGLCVGNSPGPVNSPHKGPVTRIKFPFDDVIMYSVMILDTAEVALLLMGSPPGI